jgi:hypothetical protein
MLFPRRPVLLLLVLMTMPFIPPNIAAQEFGFGFDESDAEAAGTAPAASPPAARSVLPFKFDIGGEIQAGVQVFAHDFDKSDNAASAVNALDCLAGKFKAHIGGTSADAFLNFNLDSASIGELWNRDGGLGSPSYTPRIIDEAYLRGYLGPLDIEAGLRKLTWGKADSLGPLDVVNPIDYSNLTDITDIKERKIARPLVHASWGMGDFSKLEAVFLPNFAGHRFAQKGRWVPAQFANIYETMGNGIYNHALERYPVMGTFPGFSGLYSAVENNLMNYFTGINLPETGGLEYFQTGLRFTTTIASVDLGFQYFYGNLFRPVYSLPGADAFLDDLAAGIMPQLPNPSYEGNPALLAPHIEYSRYHQIGADYAQVLWGFNARAEIALHLTKDLAGDSGEIANPFMAWSLGFDRDLLWGINANIQCNETIRFFQNKIKDNPALDCEAGTDATSTRFTFQLSRKFHKDEIECKAAAIWDIEDSGCYIIPSVSWTINDVSAELSAGVFAGEKAGELGQYWENSFVKLSVKYTF